MKHQENSYFCCFEKISLGNLRLKHTLCGPMDCSLPGCSVHGILQVRILQWVILPTPGDLSDPGIEPRSPALQVDSLLSEHLGRP